MWRFSIKKLEEWFDDVMARAKSWFADATKWRLFFIGLALAGILNADTLQIYKSLSANAALRDELVKDAELFSTKNASVAGIDTSKAFPQAKEDYLAVKQLYIETVQSPLGLGWGTAASVPTDFWAWLIKFAGWVLTGVAVTLGAPFWYDMLRKLLAIKGSAPGSSPAPVQEPMPGKTHITAFEIKAANADEA